MWAARHGGVYAPVTEHTPPNPHLSHIPERDIQTPSGRRLTLINPAYMTRQVHELATEIYGTKGHITSLNPLRPENAPDAWEAEALAAFEKGKTEVSVVTDYAGEEHLRLMRPLVARDTCLKCHAKQGYKVGDIRGGLSVSVPTRLFMETAQQDTLRVAWILGLVWLTGLVGLGLGTRRLAERMQQQHAAEDALRKSQHFLAKSQSLGHIGSWSLDIKANRLVWSEENYRIFGVPTGTPLTYESFLKCVHPDDRDYVDKKWAAAMRGEPYDIEHRLVVAGQLKWVREKAELVFADDGSCLSGSGFTQDITALRLNEQRLQSLWSVASLVDASTQELCDKVLNEIQEMTQSAYSFFGFMDENEETMVIHSWSKEALGDCAVIDQPIHFPISKAGVWANAVRNREPVLINDYDQDQPHKLGLPEGHVQITRVLSVPIMAGSRITALAACANKSHPYDHGDVEAVQTFCNSILALLERRRAEDRRDELEDRLRQSEKMKAIGELAGGIAHDFNNQLAAVLGYADMLANRLENPNLTRYAQNIKLGANRAAELTRQLLAFSRKGKYINHPVEIHKLLVEVVGILEHSIDKRITIRQKLRASPSTTIGDPTQLQNVFLNLALNARDAMPDGGELLLETQTLHLDESFPHAQSFELMPGEYLLVSVADAGSGMDEETRLRAFEPFFTTKSLGKGTGMGLASAYGTIRNHRGAITVESKVGQGTTLRVYLPLAEGAPDSAPAPSQQLIEGRARVLVVDDEEMLRDLATDMLSDLGYKVRACRNGREAVDLYRKEWQEIDLVIMDMTMPVMSGRDAFRTMREINPDVRVILSSGYTVEGDAQALLKEGVLAFIGKPFDHSELSQAVGKALLGDSAG